MDVAKLYKTDEVRERTGVWKKLGGKARIRIARAGNRDYARLFSKLVEAADEALSTKDDAADAAADAIVIEVMAKTILLEWEDMEFDGEPVPCSADPGERVKAAMKLLSVKDFRKLVMKHADDIELFLVSREEEQGNA